MWQYKGNFSKDQHVDKVMYNDDEEKEDNDELLMTKSLTTNYVGAREVAMAWGKVVLPWQLDRRRLPSTSEIHLPSTASTSQSNESTSQSTASTTLLSRFPGLSDGRQVRCVCGQV